MKHRLMLLVLLVAALFGLTSSQKIAADNLPVVQLMLVLPADGVVHSYQTDGSLQRSWEAAQELLARISGGYSFRVAPDIKTFRISVTDAWIQQNVRPNMGWLWLGGEIGLELFKAGYDVQHTQYITYYDGDPGGACSSPAAPDWADGWKDGLVGAVFLTPRCGGFDPAYPLSFLWRAALTVHVGVNALGAVPPCAPHNSSYFYVSDDPLDLMSNAESWSWDWRNAGQVVLDANHDDYFDPSGRAIGTCRADQNLANSPYLERGVYFELRVNVQGNGQVAINGQPCPSPCDRWLPKSTVQLSATTSGSQQVVWSGACSGTSSSCSVILAGNASVTATFKAKAKMVKLTVRVHGHGKVVATPAVGRCTLSTPNCDLTQGTRVGLKAVPAHDWHFVRWSGYGPCTTKLSCTVTVDQGRTLTAVFAHN